jgi:nucleotide-binding universal stress UspA family protein
MNFRKVLIAVDESSIAAYAAQVGMDLARSLNAEIALIHVFEDPAVSITDPDVPEDERAVALAAERAGTQLLADLQARLAADMEVVQFTPQGKPSEEIVAAAKDWGADLVVIGSYGRHGITRALVGSVADSVMRHAPCPVVVVRGAE